MRVSGLSEEQLNGTCLYSPTGDDDVIVLKKVKAPPHYELGHLGYRTSRNAVKLFTGCEDPICVDYDDYMDLYVWDANGEYIYVDSDGGCYR